MDLRTLRDKLEITEQLRRYAWALDTNDLESWKTVFTPDATLDYSSAGGASGSRDEVAAALQRAVDAVPVGQHSISNIEIELNGDRARVRALYFLPTQLPGSAEPSFYGGCYHHDFVRTPEGWKSERLVAQGLWSANAPPMSGG